MFFPEHIKYSIDVLFILYIQVALLRLLFGSCLIGSNLLLNCLYFLDLNFLAFLKRF